MATRAKSWADQIKTIVRRRYDNVAAADAFPPHGAARAREAGYPADWLAVLPASLADSYCGCGYALGGVDLSDVNLAVDLGCGAGLDARLLRDRLDAGARVVALDLSPRMAARARDDAIWTIAGDMERLPLADGVADLVTANASFNLTADKHAAFAEAHRILKPGGRLVARDLVRDGPLPQEIVEDPLSFNASLGGALKEDDLLEEIAAAGFADIEIEDRQPFSYVVSVRIVARRQ